MRGAWRLPALLVLLVVGAGGSPTPEDDLGPPLGVAWTHAMGGPAASERTRPRVPCVDDGPVAGAPIGGMGAGTMGRTYRGDFARWHMRVGGHTHRPAAHTLFAARVDGTATVLSALPSHAVMESVPGGGGSDRTHSRRVLPPDGTGGTYHALYPRSWYEHDPSALAPGGRGGELPLRKFGVVQGGLPAKSLSTLALRAHWGRFWPLGPRRAWGNTLV